MSTVPTTKVQKDAQKRIEVLINHIRGKMPGPFDVASLARSYGLPADQIANIITRNGGKIG